MKVRCIRELPTPKQAATLTPFYSPDRNQTFAVRLGREYTAYCIDFQPGMPMLGIRDDYEQLYPTPMCLFEVTDPALAPEWVARTDGNGSLSLEPPSFNPYYFSRLADGDPDTVADFRRVRATLEGPPASEVAEA
jgi:hypothetical protein